MPDEDLANGDAANGDPLPLATRNDYLTMDTESSQLANASRQDDDKDIDVAPKPLAREAQQTLTFGQRGVRDVTEEFAAAAKQLQAGQLVKDEYFTLFEAVGALEVCLHVVLGDDLLHVSPGYGVRADVDLRSWTRRWTVAAYRLATPSMLSSMYVEDLRRPR